MWMSLWFPGSKHTLIPIHKNLRLDYIVSKKNNALSEAIVCIINLWENEFTYP